MNGRLFKTNYDTIDGWIEKLNQPDDIAQPLFDTEYNEKDGVYVINDIGYGTKYFHIAKATLRTQLLDVKTAMMELPLGKMYYFNTTPHNWNYNISDVGGRIEDFIEDDITCVERGEYYVIPSTKNAKSLIPVTDGIEIVGAADLSPINANLRNSLNKLNETIDGIRNGAKHKPEDSLDNWLSGDHTSSEIKGSLANEDNHKPFNLDEAQDKFLKIMDGMKDGKGVRVNDVDSTSAIELELTGNDIVVSEDSLDVWMNSKGLSEEYHAVEDSKKRFKQVVLAKATILAQECGLEEYTLSYYEDIAPEGASLIIEDDRVVGYTMKTFGGTITWND